MNTKRVPALVAVLCAASLVGAGCTVSRTGTSDDSVHSSSPSTSTASPEGSPGGPTVGAAIGDAIDAARGVGMDCAHVDDTPFLTWQCFETVGRVLRSIHLVSADREHVSAFVMVASNSQDAKGDEDPLPHILDLTKVVLPAVYDGAEDKRLVDWVDQGGPNQAFQGDPLSASMLGGLRVGFINLTVLFHKIDMPNSSDVFEEFQEADAVTWGEAAGLRCQRRADTIGDSQLHCEAPSGPLTTMTFSLNDSGMPGTHPDDIGYVRAAFKPAEAGSQHATAELVANLVKRLSGRDEDSDKAREFVMTYGDAEVDREIGVLNAVLKAKPDPYTTDIGIRPAGFFGR